MQREERDSTPLASPPGSSLRSAGPLRVLGLDPGSHHTGWAMLHGEGRRVTVLGHGRLSPPRLDAVPSRLAALQAGLAELVSRFEPEVAVLETPFRGVNVRSLIILAEARGALLAELARRGLDIRELAPAEVKAAVVGSGRADKAQVARMVSLELGLESAISADAADALAVGLAFLRREPLDALRRGARPALG